MRQTFSVHHELFTEDGRGQSDVRALEADTDVLTDAPTDFPAVITGSFSQASPDEIHELRFATGVVVSLRGRLYSLESLEQDGGFVMRRSW